MSGHITLHATNQPRRSTPLVRGLIVGIAAAATLLAVAEPAGADTPAPAGQFPGAAAAAARWFGTGATSALAASDKTSAAQALPEIGQDSPQPAYALTGIDLQRLQLKQQWAAEVVAGTAGDTSPLATAAATTGNLLEPYYQQVNESYCGPATITMVAGFLHVGWSGTARQKQDAAANLLDTTSDGTAWYGHDNVPYYPGTSMYPMHDAINYRLYILNKVVWYIPTSLPDSPTSQQQADFVQNLVADVSSGYQPNGTWKHWWSARGYRNSGHTTGINDPASWSNRTEQWVTTTGGAHTVVIALGGRGYVW